MRIQSKAKPWSAEEEFRLRELYPTIELKDLAPLFGRSATAIGSRAGILGLRKAIGFGAKHPWTAEQDEHLRQIYPDTKTPDVARDLGVSVYAVYGRAGILGLKKSAAYDAAKKLEEKRRLTTAGVAHRFPKGIVPLNKGLRRPGYSIGRGRMRETQFRKGLTPQNAMPLWSFRWCDGYLMLKTGRPGPKPTSGWEYVHKLIWEQANGPLPHWRVARIWWKDSDHSNNSLSNLELVYGKDHVARTTVHRFPAPLARAIQLKGVLKRRIRKMEREQNERKENNHGEEHDGRPAQSSL